jgi:hypothetical protein
MPRAPKKQPSNEEDVKPYDKTAAPASPAKKGWTKEEKEIILFTILDSAQIDWNEMATKLNGRTATQVCQGGYSFRGFVTTNSMIGTGKGSVETNTIALDQEEYGPFRGQAIVLSSHA